MLDCMYKEQIYSKRFFFFFTLVVTNGSDLLTLMAFVSDPVPSKC